MNLNKEAFIVYVASLTSKTLIYLASPIPKMSIHLAKKDQIALLNLEKGKPPPYGPICNLEPVELKILKIYLKINLVHIFICPSKSLASAPILFVLRKIDGSLWLYVNY